MKPKVTKFDEDLSQIPGSQHAKEEDLWIYREPATNNLYLQAGERFGEGGLDLHDAISWCDMSYNIDYDRSSIHDCSFNPEYRYLTIDGLHTLESLLEKPYGEIRLWEAKEEFLTGYFSFGACHWAHVWYPEGKRKGFPIVCLFPFDEDPEEPTCDECEERRQQEGANENHID